MQVAMRVCGGYERMATIMMFVGVMKREPDKQGFNETMVSDRDSGENNQRTLSYPP